MNNESIGFYGKVVQSPEYRDAKLRTVIEMLPDLLGPGAAPFDLRFSDPDERRTKRSAGRWCPTTPTKSTRSGLRAPEEQWTEGRWRGGVPDGPPLRRWREWTTFRFEIDSGATIDVGLDGEAIRLEPPLRFESLPAALRIRTLAGRRHPGPPPLRRTDSSPSQ